MFVICSKGFKIDFQNRKWNYPNRKWNYFSHFSASDQKTSFIKCFSFIPRSSKLIFKTGNRIIQTGNGTISPNSRPLVKKTSITKCSTFDPRSSHSIFKTGNGINQTGNGIISPTSRPLIKKLIFQNVFHLFQGIQN